MGHRPPRTSSGHGQAVLAGVVAGLVGFTSSFSIVLAGFRAVGASKVEAASGLLALCLVMGVLGIALSLRFRMPISIAWSTPGAALLVSAGGRGRHLEYSSAIGAFLIAGLLAVAAGAIRPLGRLVAAIPPALAAAMLAGILLQLCFAPVEAVVRLPRLAVPVVVVWLVLEKLTPRLAVPGAVVATGVAVALTEPIGSALSHHVVPVLHWTTPGFSAAAFVGIAVPLFVVTMAAQNIPGLAVLAGFGYRPPMPPLLASTGTASAVVAPFGGHAVNLAAITAALCAGPEAHPDPDRRWIAAASAGGFYFVLGASSSALAAIALLSPTLLLETVAGLALLRPLGSALVTLASMAEEREAAVITLVVTASGISPAGIGSPFWGLVAGGAFTLFGRASRRSNDRHPGERD